MIDILCFEATRAPLIARDAPKVAELAYRLRMMGSLALSLCHLAAGRVDAVCSLKGARSVDIAAAQLLVRELGLAIDLFDVDTPFGEAPLDLEGRSRVAAALNDGSWRRSPRRCRVSVYDRNLVKQGSHSYVWSPVRGMPAGRRLSDHRRRVSAVAVYRGQFGAAQAERLLWRAGFGPRKGEARSSPGWGSRAPSTRSPIRDASTSSGRSRTTRRGTARAVRRVG